MNKIRIYVDMDDTICDFTKSKMEHLEKTPEIKYPWCQIDFFRKLKPVEDAIESLKILSEEYDVWILTRPSIKNPLCYMEKRMWVEDYLGIEWCEKLIICPDKSLLIGDYLIDDQPWDNFKGRQLLFGSKKYPNWKSILDFFNQNQNQLS